MPTLSFLTKEEYSEITKKLEGGHWTSETIDTRWDYHHRTIELIRALNIEISKDVLEMGTMGVSCVKGSDTIDYSERWNFPGKEPTYLHDARVFPWPVKNKQYELFVALRVYQHLTPYQKECTLEAMRIAKKVILVVPATYNNKVLPNSAGITYTDFVEYLNGIHPNLYLPTAQGLLYYWDTVNPSKLNLENVMNQANIVRIQTVKQNMPRKKDSILQRIKRKLKRLLNF